MKACRRTEMSVYAKPWERVPKSDLARQVLANAKRREMPVRQRILRRMKRAADGKLLRA